MQALDGGSKGKNIKISPLVKAGNYEHVDTPDRDSLYLNPPSSIAPSAPPANALSRPVSIQPASSRPTSMQPEPASARPESAAPQAEPEQNPFGEDEGVPEYEEI